MSVPQPRTPYDRRRSTITFELPSQTQQQFKDDCDINAIMKRFMGGIPITHINHREPNYGFAPSQDFRESLEIIRNAETSFAQLPADLRQLFANDPGRFLEFVENPENRPEMGELGLLTPEAMADLKTAPEPNEGVSQPISPEQGAPAPSPEPTTE